MLTNKRLAYVLLILIAITLGIVSRKIEGFPIGIGDTLYAVMVYFGMRLLFINNTTFLILFYRHHLR